MAMANQQTDFKSEVRGGRMTPVIRCSICTGEQVAGFRDNATGKFTDVMLLTNSRDLEAFRKKYGIVGEIEKIY